MLGPEEGNEPDLTRCEQAIDDADAARVDAGVIRDQADALAADGTGNVREELLDARENGGGSREGRRGRLRVGGCARQREERNDAKRGAQDSQSSQGAQRAPLSTPSTLIYPEPLLD